MTENTKFIFKTVGKLVVELGCALTINEVIGRLYHETEPEKDQSLAKMVMTTIGLSVTSGLISHAVVDKAFE